MKTFIQKYKTQAIAIITAISAAALALTPLGGLTARICEIVVATDAIVIAFLKTGLDATLINNSVALLKLLQDIYNITPVAAAPLVVAGMQGGESMDELIKEIKENETPEEEKEKVTPKEEESTTEEPSTEEAPKEEQKEKLTDDQLKDLVISYMNK